MRHDPAALLLYYPVGQPELDWIAASGWLEFPPCPLEQAVFAPALQPEYAAGLAQEWQVPSQDVAYVLRFAVDADYAATFPVQTTGRPEQATLQVPAEELPDFNRQILGQIEVVAFLGGE